MQYLKGIGQFVSVKYVAQFFLKRFVGKFVDEDRPINLDNATFETNKVHLPNLNLNCKVLNESLIGKTALRFTKFKISQLTVNFSLGLATTMSLSVDGIEIEMMPLADPERPATTHMQGVQSQNPKDGMKAQSRDRELQIVNEFIGNLLQNLEAEVTNISVRIFTQEHKSDGKGQPIPTLLFRITSLAFKNDGATDKDDLKFNKSSSVMCLLAGKQLSIGDVSLHLMKDKWLDTHEYPTEAYLAQKLDKLDFPHTYPVLNHPSTILVLKGIQRPQSIWCEFMPNEPTQLGLKSAIGNLEVMLTLKQMETLARFTEAIKQPEAEVEINPVLTGKDLEESIFILDASVQLPQKSLSESWHETATEMTQNADFMKSLDDQHFDNSIDGEKKEEKQAPIGFKGAVSINLVQISILYSSQFKPAKNNVLVDDLEHDRIFQVFQREDCPFTSCHAYLQATIPAFTIDLKSLPNSPFKFGIPDLKFTLKRFLQDQNQASQNNNLQETSLSSTMFESCVDDITGSKADQVQLVQPYDVISLVPSADGAKYSQSTIIDVKSITVVAKPNQIQAGVDKVFVKIATIDLVMLLQIAKSIPPQKKQSQPKVAQEPTEAQPMEVKVDLVGIEIELQLSANTCSYQQFLANKLPSKSMQSDHWIALNIFKVKLRHRENQTIPVLAIAQIEVALHNMNNKVTLICVSQTDIRKLPHTESVKLHQSLNLSELVQVKSDSDDDLIDRDVPLLVQTGSSVDQSSSDKKPTFLFRIDEHKQGFEINLENVACEIHSKDIPFFADFIKEQEPALKHVSNLMDIFNCMKPAQQQTTVQSLQPPMWLQLKLNQLQVVLFSSRPISQLRLSQLDLDIRIQKRENRQNIDIDFKLQNLVVVDHWNPDMDLFQADDKVQITSKQKNLITTEDLVLSGKCLVHNSNSQVALFKGNVKLCLIEEQSLQQRINLEELLLERENIRQTFVDFGEMKNNPMQVQLDLKVNCMNVYFTNQIKLLAEELQRVGSQTSKQFTANEEGLVPYKKHEQTWDLNLKQVKMNLHEFSLVYQPALTQAQIEQQLGLPLSELADCRKEVLKTCYLIALNVSKMKLDTNAKDCHNVQTQLVQVLFLREQDPKSLVDWVNYGEQVGGALESKGFAPIVSLTTPTIRVRPGRIKCKLSLVSVDVCSDTVKELTVLQKLAQVAFANKIDEIDEMVEKTVSRPVTASTEFDQSASGIVEQPIVIDADGQHPFLTQSISEEGDNTLINIDAKKGMISSDSSGHIQKFQRLRDLVDWNYFKPQERKFKQSKKVHMIPDFLKTKEPTIEIQLSLTQLRVTLYGGKDFDFLPDQQSNNPFKQSLQKSQTVVIQKQQSFNSKGGLILDRDYLSTQVENSETLLQHEGCQRARKTKRDYSQIVRLAVMHITLTRRQFPIVNDHKHKTFALSVANIDLTAVKKLGPQKKKELQMLETSYHYRHLNFFEVEIVSEKDYVTNIEELQVVVGLRPLIKVTVSFLPIEMLKKFFSEANPPQSVQPQAQEEVQQETSASLKDQQSPKDDSTKTQVLVKSLQVRETTLQLSIVDVSAFMKFDGFTLKIKSYKLFTPVPMVVPQAVEEIANFYKQQIGVSQILAQAFYSNSVTKEISRGLGNVLSPFYKPIIGAKRAGTIGVVKGFGEGVNDLASYLSGESWNVTLSVAKRVGLMDK